MVQNHYRFTEAQQIRAFCNGRLIDIHDYQYGVAACHINCLLAGDDHIFIILRIILKQLYQRLNRSRRLVQYNMGFSAQSLGNPVDTHCRPEAVHIRHPVTHNNDAILAGNDLPQGVGFYSRLDTGIFLYLLTLATVVGNALRSLDDRLVTTTSQCQINGSTGELIILCIGQTIQSDTDTDSHSHFVTDVNGLHFFQQIKTALLQLRHRFFPHDHKVFVLLQLFTDTIQGSNVFVHLTVDQCDQQGPADFLYALQRFLIVIQVDHPHREALIIHFLQCNVQRGLIKQIDCDQIAVVPFRIDHIAVFCHFLQGNLTELCYVFTAFILQFVLCLIHTGIIRKPVPGNGREQGSNGFVISLWLVHHIFKGNIRPDHLAGIIQKGIRQFQIPQQFPLDLSILRGKTDQFIHNDRFIIEIQCQCNCKIEDRKSESKQSGTKIQHKYRGINCQQQKSQIQGELNICTDSSLQSDSFFHQRTPLNVCVRQLLL